MGKPSNITAIIGTVATIFSLLVASGSIVWGASKIDSRVADIEKWIVANADTQIKLMENRRDNEQLLKNQENILLRLETLDLKVEKKRDR